MKKWMDKISQWKLDKKMQLLVTTVILVIALLMLAVSTISSVTSMKQKSIELLQANNDTMSDNFENALSQYKALAVAMVLDDTVQSYLKCTNKRNPDYSMYANNAVNTMESCQNMNPDMKFLAVVSYQMDDFLYKRTEGVISSRFQQVYTQDFQNARKVQNSTIRISVSNKYDEKDSYTVNIYFPIYDINVIMMEKGLLCMSFESPMVDQIIGDGGLEHGTSIIHTDGTVIADWDTEHIGEKTSYVGKLTGEEGSFSWKGRLYIYQKVNGWDYYIVSSMETMELYAPSIRTLVIMAGVLFVTVLFSVFVVKKPKKWYNYNGFNITVIDRLYNLSLFSRSDF